MEFIHMREYLNSGDVVVVSCSRKSNVMLTNDINFNKYKYDKPYNYYGGAFTKYPAKIPVPRTGHWNITIDVGGEDGTIEYSVKIFKG